jgi:NIMA (never in mitosis gene a)-related kinase
MQAMAQTCVGTPFYLSPELCDGRAYDAKSDVWSLGCVLYEMCALQHPFRALNQAALALRIMNARYEPLSPCYSKSMHTAVLLCLRRDARRRPTVVEVGVFILFVYLLFV